jgi:PleD family two-component response regulator
LGAELHVTVTAGVAEAQRGEDSVALIKAAESALKSAKAAGRNCTHYFDARLHMPVAAAAVAAV